MAQLPFGTTATNALGIDVGPGSYFASRPGANQSVTFSAPDYNQGSVQAASTGGYRAPVDSLATLRAGFNAQKGNIYGTARDAASTAGRSIGSSILDFIDSLKSDQRKIDEQGIQNEKARTQGQQGVMGMVSRGIRSGGTMLANKNASNSSAALGIANAYGDIGRRELTGVGQQYEQGNREIAMSQADLEQQRASGARRIGESKLSAVDSIVAQARDGLAQLDAQMLGASLPDRIAIEQEKDAIKQEVLGILAQYDQQLQQGVSGVQALTPEQRRAQAAARASEGVAPEDAFSFTDAVPAQFQNSPFSGGSLPIFTRPRNREV